MQSPGDDGVDFETLARDDGATIAYRRTRPSAAGLRHDGHSLRPGIVFLGGFGSDMTGSKASALEDHCRAAGYGFLRFDYTGHGRSTGRFEDGTIGQWTADALFAIDRLTEGPQILIGSSMGGWIMLNVALARSERIAGLIGIAAAPDFTEELFWRRASTGERERLARDGVWYPPEEEGLPITARLIAEARRHLRMLAPIPIRCPVRLLQGMNDASVPWQTASRLAGNLVSDDVVVSLVKSGDHRLSTPDDLARLTTTLDALVQSIVSSSAASPSR